MADQIKDAGEKGGAPLVKASSGDEKSQESSLEYDHHDAEIAVPSKLRNFNQRIENLAGFEARGIARVPPEERIAPSTSNDMQVALLWLSANLSINNLAVGLFGPLVFGLGFLDSALLAVFGAFLGSCSTAYMSVWGAPSGNRTMVGYLTCP